MTPMVSGHAERRSRQRGIPLEAVRVILECADEETPVGGSCVAFRVSRAAAMQPEVRARAGRHADRLSRVVLVWSAEGNNLVTVLRMRRGASGRHYRRAS